MGVPKRIPPTPRPYKECAKVCEASEPAPQVVYKCPWFYTICQYVLHYYDENGSPVWGWICAQLDEKSALEATICIQGT